jgi:hypothetical protein
MVRPIISVYRWYEHGDLRVHLPHPAGPLFAAADVCELLELDVPTYHDHRTDLTEYLWPGAVTALEGSDDPWYTVAEAIRVAENNPSHLTPLFLAYVQEIMAGITAAGLERLVDDATPTPEAARDLSRTWSVRLAARALSKDPALTLGQNSLFEAMQAIGWIHRVDSIWQPDPDLVKRGLLLQQHERIRGHKELYPRIRITVTGMRELHQRLGGIATLTLDPEPTLTLVEDL